MEMTSAQGNAYEIRKRLTDPVSSVRCNAIFKNSKPVSSRASPENG